MDKTKQKIISKAFSAIIFAGIPFWYIFIQSLIVKTNLFLGYPHNSDEFCYWRVLYSFSQNGFDFGSTCGYYGTDAPIGPLGEHGLSTLFAWAGTLLLGNVNAHTLFLWNIILLSISLLVLYVVAKPSVIECFLIIGVLLCNAVVQEQWFSHMMELPCIAVIILCFTMEIAYRRYGKNLWLILGLIAALWATYMRICYIILVFPFLIVLWDKKSFDKFKKAISVAIMLVVFAAVEYSSTLFMKTSVSFLSDLKEDVAFLDKLSMLFDNAQMNLLRYFALDSGSDAEVGQRYLQVAIICILIIVAVFQYRKDEKFVSSLLLVQAFSMVLLITAMIFLYDIADWRDVRTTMPFAIGIMIWLILTVDDVKVQILLLLFTLILQGSPLREELLINHPADRYEISDFNESWIGSIENTKDILCLYNVDYDSRSMFLLYENIPSKIGILKALNYDDIINGDVAYVITSQELVDTQYELIDVSDRYGYIYRNSK